MAEATVPASPPVTRREFLYYAWIASMSLATAGSIGAVLWFSYPIFREGEFGGEFPINPGSIPGADAAPEDRPDGRFWLVRNEEGVLAIYKVCTHLGCLYKWVPANTRFECPCHGSKYQKDGTWIEGPAPRSLDRFVVRVLDANGNVIAQTQEGNMNVDPEAGQPVPVPDNAAEIRIDTGSRILGPLH